ncbi:MAG: ligase-associated DNA damage response exonuclease [Panacagrimonas sp.]
MSGRNASPSLPGAAPAPDLVTATEQGLYCAAGDFHIDPCRPVARAVITHAHADHARSGSQHYWCSTPGLGLTRARVGYAGGITAVDYGQRFQMGDATVSLHPAGHVLGSSQVRIEAGGQVWVVSGDYKRDADPSCAPFEPVPCDVFITESTFGLPVYRWPDPAEVARDIFEWWQACKAAGECAVLCCYALGKAQRVLAELLRLTGETVYLHGAMTPLVKLYREAGIAMVPTEPVGNQPRFFDWKGKLLLAPPGAAGTPWIKRFKPCSVAFASGWMRVRGSRRRQAWDRGFVLSDHADWNGLLLSIEQSGARRVLAMHGNTDALIETLRARGIDAAPLHTGREAETAARQGLDSVEEAAAGAEP